MAENICPNCHHKNRLPNKFCTQCGSKLIKSISAEPYLEILTKDKSKIVFRIKEGRSTIGRNITNTIVIDDKMISNFHAVIVNEDEEICIEDLESKNGIFLNGLRITERAKLNDGCIIKLGSTMIRFHSNDE
ncbi:MAG: FHA domain-containing protein [Calditrichaceae bacterium]|nr:FHA domain-containing protein [Calditrichaceae bacterium]